MRGHDSCILFSHLTADPRQQPLDKSEPVAVPAHHVFVLVFLLVIVGGHLLHSLVVVLSGLGELVLLKVLLVLALVDQVPQLRNTNRGGQSSGTQQYYGDQYPDKTRMAG